MYTKHKIAENAVAAIRISSLKQGLQGDSPEDQKEQLERFATSHNINIKKFFIFIESASKEQQPVQEAIDYCKKTKNDIQLLIIKSIDRFTRGGSYLYDHLKQQLEKYNVNLVDIYGVIGNQQINTLDHLGVEYSWSKYNPTKKSELLEAERAKDEMRDIMTRMIGAEIRYVRMGYRVRRSPYGYRNKKIETEHGRRVILKPKKNEAKFIRKMFQLRSRGTLNDRQIIKKINKLGYKSRKQFKRDPADRTKTIGETGGNTLVLLQLWRYISNPIYAGVSFEKWTRKQPIKTKFKGLVSINLFNKANKGKLTIIEKNGKIVFYKKQPPKYLTNKQVQNPKFPYKRVVLCPHCQKPLYGSASKGKSGKYYPAYHCNKRGHYFRVPSQEFNDTIKSFVKELKITPEYVEKLNKYVLDLWAKRQTEVKTDNSQIDQQISSLKFQTKSIVDKIKMLSSETAIKYLETDLIEISNRIKSLKDGKKEQQQNKTDMAVIMDNVSYFLEHFEKLLIDTKKPLKKAAYFSLLFDQLPTYQELLSGTPKLAPFLGIKKGNDRVPFSIGDPTENRTPVCWMRTNCPSR